MEERTYASIESQLGNDECTVEDTEEMFWLRQSDDYESHVKLGNLLSGHYRFKEAVEAYKNAMKIRTDDPMLYIRLAGALLTLRKFDEAFSEYHHALELGANEKSVAYPLGIWHYLKKDYVYAAAWFEKCLPCGDEMVIAVIYWHTLCCTRMGTKKSMLPLVRDDMKVGHHTAYIRLVSVFCGKVSLRDAMEQLNAETSDLNYVVTAYGLCVYLELVGKYCERDELMQKCLSRNSVWPCISYLAAWNDWKL